MNQALEYNINTPYQNYHSGYSPQPVYHDNSNRMDQSWNNSTKTIFSGSL